MFAIWDLFFKRIIASVKTKFSHLIRTAIQRRKVEKKNKNTNVLLPFDRARFKCCSNVKLTQGAKEKKTGRKRKAEGERNDNTLRGKGEAAWQNSAEVPSWKMYLRKRLFNFYRNNPFAFFLGSTWVFMVNGGLLFGLKYIKHFDNRHTYIEDAIDILKLYLNCSDKDNLKMIKRKGNIDSSNKHAKCELQLTINDENINLNVNAIKLERGKNQRDNSGDTSANYEYDEEEAKDISDYLENPYLIKKEIKFLLKKIKLFLSSFTPSKENEEKTDKEKGVDEIFLKKETHGVEDKNAQIRSIIENGNKWKINNILMVKKRKKNGDRGKVTYTDDNLLHRMQSLLGGLCRTSYEICPIYGNPAHNSYYYKYENKKKTFNETQKNIGKVMLCAFFLSTALAIKRFCLYKNSYSSLNFVKNFVLNNKELHSIMKDNQIQILSISGLHEKNYLNSKIFFQTRKKQGVVQVTATKNSQDATFFILCAKLLLNNETVELKHR
ncbi:conserved Plasmodium protein, unknown function [Plasmodium ovale curtisi]|uniref:Uncharacterized protein n=1 Tax=Plasmodium ovale curtisi TaxID=864141 RepID=A0A1A8WBM0_PLAOA|nr:conserved Plasmodium protein, unknown function [Plasmodium ovale curtisi]